MWPNNLLGARSNGRLSSEIIAQCQWYKYVQVNIAQHPLWRVGQVCHCAELMFYQHIELYNVYMMYIYVYIYTYIILGIHIYLHSI